jgi:RNA methyltransferase, TrmH family
MSRRLVTSASNPRIASARRLRRRSERARSGRLLLEGERVILEALELGVVEDLFVLSDAGAIHAAAESASVPAVVVSEPVMRSLSDTVTPQGAVAVARSPVLKVAALTSWDLVLVLDAVRDPGNAGTLLRTAAAAGASGVVFTTGSVEAGAPKTVRSSAGALFRVPVATGDGLEEVAALAHKAGATLVGTAARAARSLYEVDLRGPLALVVGNEAWGLPPERRGLLDVVASIPMPGPQESLNVAVAGSVALFEAVRQRLH